MIGSLGVVVGENSLTLSEVLSAVGFGLLCSFILALLFALFYVWRVL